VKTLPSNIAQRFATSTPHDPGVDTNAHVDKPSSLPAIWTHRPINNLPYCTCEIGPDPIVVLADEPGDG
jgi:hypothetical protein